jgi:diguanylate cyclase (GGDEF)-like protein
MVDIDHFKHINDSIGHIAGDTVLKAVAARMKDCLREYDYIGRYGGEEFLVVLGDADFESAIRTADRLNQAVGSKEILCGNQLVSVTISAGVAVSADCAILNSDRMVSAADHALYKAKHEGRNRVEVSRL